MTNKDSTFLRPSDEDFISSAPWKEDKVDVEPIKETAFVYNSSPALSLQAQRHKLPIFKNKNHILYLLSKFQTLIIVGETGCGKSTQVPQFLLEGGWADDPGMMIGVTEPRRIAATTLASRVAEERKSVLGNDVGYSIRFDDKFDREKTKIKFMTEGILIREMSGDPLLKHYAALIIDEAHERTTQTDIILGLLKKILRKRRELRVIVSSATVDAEYLRDFFNSENSEKAKIISIEGTNYSVDIFYLSSPCPDYVKESAETAMKLHRVESPGDILIFLTGMEEVDTCVHLLKEMERSEKKNSGKYGLGLSILPMYGSLQPLEQLKVFRPSSRGFRKVVVATNIAETSITIDGIAYVIDSCYVKYKWYNAESNVDSLIVTEVSQASAQQRAGRAGRTRPGQCYRLCLESDFEKLPLYTPPEMQRTDLSNAVLQLKALGIDNVVRFEFASSPPSTNLIASMELLYALGAIDQEGHLTQPLGEQMSEFPIHPTLSKMLLSSRNFDCSLELIIIVAMLQVESVFVKSPLGSSVLKARIAKRKFEVEQGDLLTLLNVYKSFEDQGENKHWCSAHFLKYKALKRVSDLKAQLMIILKRLKIPLRSGNTENVLKCIVSGLFPNAAYLHSSGSYRTIKGNLELFIHPTSLLYTLRQPSWVVFAELVHTTKVFMKEVTSIDPSWLLQLAPHYYEKTNLTTH